jgi:hypothetical protein
MFGQMKCVKWEAEQVTRALKRSDALREYLEEKPRMSSRKVHSNICMSHNGKEQNSTEHSGLSVSELPSLFFKHI